MGWVELAIWSLYPSNPIVSNPVRIISKPDQEKNLSGKSLNYIFSSRTFSSHFWVHMELEMVQKWRENNKIAFSWNRLRYLFLWVQSQLCNLVKGMPPGIKPVWQISQFVFKAISPSRGQPGQTEAADMENVVYILLRN